MKTISLGQIKALSLFSLFEREKRERVAGLELTGAKWRSK
jgi:hypothetical protein